MAESETEYASENHKFRQGDILKIVSLDSLHSSPSLGVIINADCDLENGKIDGTIAYLPIFSFKQYLTEFWAPKFIKSNENDAVSAILQQTGLEENEASEVLHLLESYSQTEVVKRLSDVATSKINSTKLTQMVNKLAICVENNLSPYDSFRKICALQNDPQKFARKQIDTARNTMGDGHFFISEIVGQEEVGFVIRMQRIFSLPETRVFNSLRQYNVESNHNETIAFRVAKLSPLYRFKVMQLFSHQFSRVGLPNQITELSSLAVDDLVANIVEVQ